MIIFLHGPDTFRSRQKLKETRERFKREVDQQGYNLTVLDGKNTRPGKLTESFFAAPFLARKRMVIVEQLSEMDLSDAETEILLDVLHRAQEAENILVIFEEGLSKVQLKNKIMASLLKGKFVLEFPAFDGKQVAGWMLNQFTAQNLQIHQDALNTLSLSVGDDLWQAQAEVSKLSAYAAAKGLSVIDLATVKALVASGLHDDVFALVDATSSQKPKEALWRLHEQLENGSHELELVSLLLRQYRLAQQVLDATKQGLSPDQIASVYRLHPFVVRKMLSQVRSMDEKKIQQAYRELVALDEKIKSSGISPTLLLSKSVAHLAVA